MATALDDAEFTILAQLPASHGRVEVTERGCGTAPPTFDKFTLAAVCRQQGLRRAGQPPRTDGGDRLGFRCHTETTPPRETTAPSNNHNTMKQGILSVRGTRALPRREALAWVKLGAMRADARACA